MRKRLGESVGIVVAVMFFWSALRTLHRRLKNRSLSALRYPRRFFTDGMRNGASNWRSRKLMPQAV